MDEESSSCILFFSIKDAGNIPPNGWNAHTFGCPDLLSTHSGGWHLCRRCCKVGLAPVDCKASRVSGGPSSSLLPIFMTPLYWTTPPHPSCLNFVYTFVLRACHWGHTSELRKVLRHFFFSCKEWFRDSISHTLTDWSCDSCGYLVNLSTFSCPLLYKQKHCKTWWQGATT